MRFVNNIVSRFPYFLRWTSFRSYTMYGGSTFLWSMAVAHVSMKNVRSEEVVETERTSIAKSKG